MFTTPLLTPLVACLSLMLATLAPASGQPGAAASPTPSLSPTPTLTPTATLTPTPTPAPAEQGLSIFHACILGVVEGITEYLPVSSTGHLILTSNLLGIKTPAFKRAIDDFEIIIQGGAILAVLGLYWSRFAQMFRGILGKDPDGLRLFINVCIAFVPAAGIGFFLNSTIKSYLFFPVPVIIAMIVGGVYMLVIDTLVIKPRRARALAGTGIKPGIEVKPGTEVKPGMDTSATAEGREVTDLTPVQALIIGFMQVLAMWPGTSRSMMTITGGVLVGLKPRAAAEFSFLLGMPTLLAATLYSLYKNLKQSKEIGEPNMFVQLGYLPVAVGIIVAAISAAIAVKWLVGFLNRHGLAPFGYYRIVLGAVLIVLLMMGKLQVG